MHFFTEPFRFHKPNAKVLVHTYDASISTSARKSTCEPGRHKHKHKRKKTRNVSSSYACACACVAPVHTYFFLRLCLCLRRTWKCLAVLFALKQVKITLYYQMLDRSCWAGQYTHILYQKSIKIQVELMRTFI